MNTVMDDNKMLTLASNERIPLTPSMRLLLEINHMNHCSPATVSRGGVIFVNADDVGWKPVVDSWIEKLEVGGVCVSGWVGGGEEVSDGGTDARRNDPKLLTHRKTHPPTHTRHLSTVPC